MKALLWIALAVLLLFTHYWTYSVGLEFGLDLAQSRYLENRNGDR